MPAAAVPFRLTELDVPQTPVDPSDEAAVIVARAHAEAERLRQEAYAAGFAAGEAEAAATMDAQLALAAAAVDGARTWADEAEERFARDAAELALVTAEKLVGAALEADPGMLEGVVRRALRRARRRERLVLTVHPDDLETARALLPRLDAALGTQDVAVVDDPRVRRGGCLLDTPAGEIDATVASQLDRARDAIRKAGSR